MTAKNNRISRWFFLVPVALVSSFLVRFPLHWILYSLLCKEGIIQFEEYPKAPEILLAPLISGFVFIYIIGSLAPVKKFEISLLFCCLWSVFGLFSYYLGFNRMTIANHKLELSFGGLPILLGIIGVFSAYVVLRLKDKNDKSINKKVVSNLNLEIEITEDVDDMKEVKIFFIAMFFLSVLTLVFPIIRVGILYLIAIGLFVSFGISINKEGLKALIKKKFELFIFTAAILSLLYTVISDVFFSFGTIFFAFILILTFKKTTNKKKYDILSWVLFLIAIIIPIWLNFDRLQNLFPSN